MKAVATKEYFIGKAIDYLKEDILKFAEETDIDESNQWPPTFEVLNERKPPESVTYFLTGLLKHNRHVTPERAIRLVESYASDLIHGVTNGRFITAKHFAVSMGLHGLTGSREIIDILSKLGNAMPYELTCEIETAQAEKAQKMSKESTMLPLIPQDDGEVPTVFWVDNFDCIIECVTGGGSVNTTHMMVFQEMTENTVINQSDENVERKKTRKFIADDLKGSLSGIKIDNHAGPPIVSTPGENFQDDSKIAIKYFIWLLLRKTYGVNAYKTENDQIIPNFAGTFLTFSFRISFK